MSTLSSSINALASAAVYDFWVAMKPGADERAILRAGRIGTVIWTLLLIGAAIGFIPLSRVSTAVEVSLGIASLVYGGLIGTFALARFSSVVDGVAARAGLVVGVGAMVTVWVTARSVIAWPWFVLFGTGITVVVGLIVARFRLSE